MADEVSAQWHAFNQVLDYLNTVDTKLVAKKDVYAAVMEMRPKVNLPEPYLHLLREAYTAMSIASALPSVDAAYDFSPVLESVRAALSSEPHHG